MANPFLGRGGTLGFGIESTWGTPVARSNWVRAVSLNLKRTINNVPRPHLGTLGATSHNRRQYFVSSDEAGGSLEVLFAYDDSTELLLQHLFGAVADAGAGPYTHTYTLSASTPVGLTIEQILGTGSAEVFEGCRIVSGEISIAVADVMRLKCDIIAQTSGGLASAGTPTYSSNGEEALHHQAGQLSFNGNTFDLSAMSVKIDSKQARRQLLGSKLTSEPAISDFAEVSGSFTVEYTDSNLHDDFIAGTQADATITFTGTTNNAAAFTFQNMLITDVAIPVSGPGIISQTVNFQAFSDGTDEGFKLVVTNDNALSTAN